MTTNAASQLWSGVDIGRELFVSSPMIALICTMLAVVACPIVLGRGTRTITTVVVMGIGVTFYYAIRVAGAVDTDPTSGLAPGTAGGTLIADNLTAGFQIVLLIFLTGVIGLWWMGSSAAERNAPEFFILLLGSALGMMLMVATTNLLVIIIAIETASLPSYALVGFDKRSRAGAEASVKYMIFGAVSAAIMIYGASMLYGLCGSFNAADIARTTLAYETMSAGRQMLLWVALLCFFVGILFKISAVPFHFWCPDAFQGAKIEVTTWLSVASKAAGLLLLARLVTTFCSAPESVNYMGSLAPLAWTIAIVAAITCTVGNFCAYAQQSVKRLLAYSSIAHAGYMMMAAAVFVHPSMPGHENAITALFLYVIIYLFMNLGAFGVASLVVWHTGGDDIGNFNGLIRRAPWLAVPMVVCLVSLVGLPPMAGFLGKWWILVALGGLQSNLGWFLIIVAVMNTLISLYYYLRIVVRMTLRDDGQPPVRAPLGGVALVNFCAVVLLVLFVFATPLRSAAQRFSRNLYRAAPTPSVAVDESGASTLAASTLAASTLAASTLAAPIRDTTVIRDATASSETRP